MSDTGLWLLGAATVIGGVAIGKAATDHLALPREQRAVTAQGIPSSHMDKLVQGAATAVTLGYVLLEGPAVATEWWKQAQGALR